jgi:hypothetical protein
MHGSAHGNEVHEGGRGGEHGNFHPGYSGGTHERRHYRSVRRHETNSQRNGAPTQRIAIPTAEIKTAQGVDSATRDVIPAEVATKIGHEEGKAKKDQRDSTVELGQQSSLNQAAGGAKKVCAMWLAWARYS